MKNLWWRDGLLGCRDGQEYLSETTPGRGICCHDRLFWGRMVAHIGDGLYAAVPGEWDEIDDFLTKADRAMYEEKNRKKSARAHS